MAAKRGGMIAAAVMLGTLVGVSSARGEVVAFLFTAVDADGRVATGGFTHDTDWYVNLVFPNLPDVPGGAGDVRNTPLLAFASVDGLEAVFTPGPELFVETAMGNNAFQVVTPGGPPQPIDYFGIVIFAGSLPGLTFSLELTDADATAFDSLRLPGELDLQDFETRRRFSFSASGGGFSGEITSITRSPVVVIPEPSTLALCGIAAGGIALAVRRRKGA